MNTLTKLEQVAAMALQGFLASGRTTSPEVHAREAVEYAQALLAEVSKVQAAQTVNQTYGGWVPCPHCGKPMVNTSPTVKL
jgi:hypothetical protein